MTLPTRDANLQALIDLGIPHTVKNAGSHVTIGDVETVVNFWPSTSRWAVARSPHNGKGVQSLVDWLHIHHPSMLKGKS
jgi:hypothetical protein